MMGSIERNVPKTLGNYDVIYMCVVGNSKEKFKLSGDKNVDFQILIYI